MTTFFTSDEHYHHRGAAAHRPFTDLDHMHQELIRRHNAVVLEEDDIVIHVGDFCLDEGNVKDILSALRGRHFLVSGNHDRCHHVHERHERYERRYLNAGFRMVTMESMMTLPGVGRVKICHLPYVGDHTHEERYPAFRPKVGEEVALLHGHVHEIWKTRFAIGIAPLMVNVGVDQWDYTPVCEQDLAAEILKQVRS